jgi:hypothetical protein
VLPGKPSLGETANEFGELRGQTGEQTGAPKSGDRIILFWPEGDQHLLSAGDARTLCRIRPTKISLLVVRAPSLGIRRALHAVVSARFGVWPLATASGPRLCVASAGAGKAVGPSMPIAQQISLAIDHAFDERAVIVRSQGPKLSVFCGQRRHIDVLPHVQAAERRQEALTATTAAFPLPQMSRSQANAPRLSDPLPFLPARRRCATPTLPHFPPIMIRVSLRSAIAGEQAPMAGFFEGGGRSE